MICNVARFFLIHLFLGISFFTPCVSLATNNSGTDGILCRYQAGLDSVSLLPPALKLDYYKTFCNDNSDFDRIYLTLFYEMVVQRNIKQVNDYFNSLIIKYPDNPYPKWILAKGLLMADQPENAFDLLVRASIESEGNTFIFRDLNQLSRFINVPITDSLINDWFPSSVRKKMENIRLYYQSNHQQLIDILEKKKHPFECIEYYHYLGNIYLVQFRYDEADIMWRRGLDIARRADDWFYMANFLANLGIVERRRGHYDLSICYYDSSDALASKTRDFDRMHLNAGNRGNIYLILEQFQNAEIEYRRAIELADRYGFYSSIGYWYYNIAPVSYTHLTLPTN